MSEKVLMDYTRCSCGAIATPGDSGYYCEKCGDYWPYSTVAHVEEEYNEYA